MSDFGSKEAMNTIKDIGNYQYIQLIIGLIGGGLGGSVLTFIANIFRGKIQYITAKVTVDEFIVKIPAIIDGKKYESIKYMEFEVENTTNKDLDKCDVHFVFPPGAKIYEFSNISKLGVDKIKKISKEEHRICFRIRTFNRKNKTTFKLKIADLPKNEYFIEVSGALGVEVKVIKPKIIMQKIEPSSEILPGFNPRPN